MSKRNYIIYSDESDKKGKYCSNFFGGVMLRAEDQQQITALLNLKKQELNLNNEIKWERVTANYLDKYIEFMDFYFSLIKTSRLKVRIMFTQNMYVPTGLSKEQYEEQYFILYYQFFKHSFGMKYCNPNSLDRVYFHLMPDQLPDSEAKCNKFKNYLSSIPESQDMKGCNVYIPRRNITEVDSSNHPILQGLDIILGSMCAKLNEKFLTIPEGKRRRGKRTIAKEKLYKSMNQQIREIRPNFNVGVSTATHEGLTGRWDQPYMHWKFKPKNHKVDRSLTKGK